MAQEALSVIPSAVLRNLSDKLYEKRKNAALEIEGIVKQLATAGEHEKISAVILLLTHDYTYSPQANHRKGGLIGLAAVTVGLTSEAAQHLEQIVPPVLNSFLDQDSRVRYYACEALYNIAKVVRGDFIIYFNKIFDALCKLSADSDANVQSAAHLLDRLVKDIVTESDQFSIEEFIPLLRERMNVLNPYVRQFLVGWITVLDSVPDIDMLGFLPDFLDGLFNMLSDSSHEIRQQADAALSEFLQEIKNSPNVDYGRMAEILVRRAGSTDEFTRLTSITWINEFVKLGGEQLVPYYADILGAILPCISDEEEKIRVVARETNEELRAIKADPAEGFDIGAILSIAIKKAIPWWCNSHPQCWEQMVHKWCGAEWAEMHNACRERRLMMPGAPDHQGNLSLDQYAARWSAAHDGQPCSQFKAWAMTHKGKTTSDVDYNPEDPPSTYTNETVHNRLSQYTEMARSVHGPEYDPTTAELDPEVIMRVGGGKKHGRYWIADSTLDTATTPTLAQIRARSTSSCPPICPRPGIAQHRMETTQAQLEEEKRRREEMEVRMEHEQQRMVAKRQRMEADRQRMELMFQWMQNLGASMGQSPPPELLAPLPPPKGTPNQSAASNNMPHQPPHQPGWPAWQ